MSQQGKNSERKADFYDMPIDLHCVINTDNKQIQQANPAFEYILGWKESEVVNQPFSQFISASDQIAEVNKIFEKISLGIHSLSFQSEFKTKNDLSRFIDWKCYVDAEAKAIFAIGRDITSLKTELAELSRQSHLDELTQLNNRQTFLTLLKRELSSSFRHQHPTAIALINIDHFSLYNQQNGPAKADERIKQVAHVLKTCLRRKTDFLARFENDEFIITLTRNDLQQALKSAQYLHENLKKIDSITTSISVCAISEKIEKEVSTDQVLMALKEAMILNRQNGGNQINDTTPQFN